MASAWLRNALFESLEVKAVERKTPRFTVFFMAYDDREWPLLNRRR